MRKLWLLALALLVPTASADLLDDTDFPQTYYARIAVGDIPTTTDVEADGILHVVEYLRFTHPTGDNNESLIAFGAGQDAVECSCSAMSIQDGTARVHSTTPPGDYILAVQRSVAAADAYAVPLPMYGASIAADARINIYAQPGMDVTGPVTAARLPGDGGPWTIHFFDGTASQPLPSDFWATLHPAVAAPETPVVTQEEGFGYLELVIGILAGALIWFYLVQKGFVQARTRKQVIQKAAHEEVATEGKATLEARKRVLMAGLKELEMAKMKGEIEDATYDRLKSELKRETVTTMRALEAAQ